MVAWMWRIDCGETAAPPKSPVLQEPAVEAPEVVRRELLEREVPERRDDRPFDAVAVVVECRRADGPFDRRKPARREEVAEGELRRGDVATTPSVGHLPLVGLRCFLLGSETRHPTLAVATGGASGGRT